MLKRRVKRAATATLGRLPARTDAPRVVVICYHSIHPSLPFASATPDMFARHLAWLGENCDVVPLRDVPHLCLEPSLARPAVAITFDDGYLDNYMHALPALESARMTATFFATAGLVERNRAVVARMAMLRGTGEDAVAAFDRSQARDLVARGFEVGSHTWSHANLARSTDAARMLEIRRAKETLEDALDSPVPSFAYPFGKPGRHFSKDTERAVAAVGHDRAAAVLARGVRPSDSIYAIPRFFSTGDTVEQLRDKVLGRGDWLGVWQEHSPRWLARVISPVDFRQDPIPRSRDLPG